MATVDVQTAPAMPKANFKPIIRASLAAKKDSHGTAVFDPKVHLSYKAPENTIMMEDIGFTKDSGICPIAVSEPFSLFTEECIQLFRDEVLSEEVQKNCAVESNIAACQVRGYAAKYAPFIYDAWNHPEVLAIVSKIAGIELIPQMDLEIGHTNISVKSERESKAELAVVEEQKKSHAEDEGIAGCPWEDDKPILGWHNDSYPFVCITMLSDCTNMVGGETAMRTGTGGVMRVRGPQMGCAVVMQGRCITHQALRALGAQERITMVTSFRPKSPHYRDDVSLATVRGISNISDLYHEFSEYRLEMLEERIRHQLKKLRGAHGAGKRTDTKQIKAFLKEQMEFLERTDEELVPDELVVKGQQPIRDIPNAVSSASEQHNPEKRARTE
ncbi:hypothetical protein PRZ48_008146 [Zasmidium cellare]|uniref:Uncharacterized protein n=1 Tax=Zasmidium cellare TaxID=395010 RepID=A0ABR0EF93_ZASCE|nr:hypothetical protein PRZ48_008146 [Zasmidium cellare]